MITGTTAVCVRVTGEVPGPVGLATVPVDVIRHSYGHWAPAAVCTSEPLQVTLPVSYVVVRVGSSVETPGNVGGGVTS